MRLKSEKARRDKLAYLSRVIRQYEERYPHFPHWLELLREHSGMELEELGRWQNWPTSFFLATGVAQPQPQRASQYRLPDEVSFFFYIEALAYREKVVRARLGKPKGAVPKPDPVHDTPSREPMRPPRR